VNISAQQAATRPYSPDARSPEPLLRPRTFGAQEILVRQGQPAQLFRLTSGWVAEQRFLSNGRRQIVDLAIPGDIVGFGEEKGTGKVAALLNRAMAVRNARLVDHLVRLGQLSAIERAAQVFLSLYDRLSAAGLVTGHAMPMPLTQAQLAEHLGMSVVHVNRTLQQLRRDGLLEIRNGRAVLRDRTTLAAMCDYRLRSQPA
jgi:CRP-like cAMP-binding protein